MSWCTESSLSKSSDESLFKDFFFKNYFNFRQFDMQLSQDCGPKSPLSISLASDFIDILFQESETSDKIPLAVVRKSQKNIELKHKLAARISITVCMDESQRLQGKFDSNDKMNMKSRQREFSDSEQFFVSAAGVSGDTR